MRPALEVLLLKSHDFDNNKLQSFAKSAVDDFIGNIRKMNDCVLSSKVKDEIVKRLNNMTILSAFFAETFNEKHLEKYYEELKLKGDENLVQSAMEIRNFLKRVSNDDEPYSIRSKLSVDIMSKQDIVWYFTRNNRLCKINIFQSKNLSW